MSMFEAAVKKPASGVYDMPLVLVALVHILVGHSYTPPNSSHFPAAEPLVSYMNS